MTTSQSVAIPDDMPDLRELYLAEIRAERRAIRLMRDATISGDVEKFADAFEAVESCMVFARAFRALDGLSAPEELRVGFMRVWESDGNTLRCSCDDLSLMVGLRALMPTYDGPGLTLYRGCGWSNRVRRTYGMSWTPRLDVARAFAESRKDMYHRTAACSLKPTRLQRRSYPRLRCSPIDTTRANMWLTDAS